jgi:protein-S-isoprenylcysteine O-methyltransferase Ste14
VLFNHILLAILWILFGAAHSLLASNTLKEKVSSIWPRIHKYYRIYYTLFALISFTGIILFQVSIPSSLLFAPGVFSKAIGCMCGAAGLGIMLVCIRKYFFNLSGLKTLVTEKEGNELIITGIHKHIRHPLYLGTFIFIWGLFVYIPLYSLLIANSVITIYTLWGISLEENKLEQEFGDQYRAYKASVPMLIPFL